MATDKDARMKILEETIASIDKTYGKGTIMKLGDGVINPVESISTGSLALDHALGIGGVPRGRIVEIYGPESSGKTTLCLHIIAEAQKAGGLAAFIDAEHAMDLNYAKRLKVDTKNLLLSQPDFGEQALEIVDTLVRSNALDIIVIDSVAALVPRSEIEGDMGDPQMALQARLMSQALRKLTGAISKSKTCVIFTNQLRSKIGVMFGNPETTTGGNALKFYASVRLDIRRVGALKDGQNVFGNRTKVKIVKSKIAPPFKEVEFDILYNEGISKAGEIIDLASEKNLLNKSGSWFTYKENRYQGRDQLKSKMLEDPELFASLEKDVMTALGMIKDVQTKPVKEKEETETKSKKK